MACCHEGHKKLDEWGVGKCSVPMWCMGVPAGFCDNDAYGKQLDRFIDRAYAPFLACPAHGGPATRVFKDGDSYCAVRPDFVNLQSSPAGFGPTRGQSRAALIETENAERKAKP